MLKRSFWIRQLHAVTPATHPPHSSLDVGIYTCSTGHGIGCAPFVFNSIKCDGDVLLITVVRPAEGCNMCPLLRWLVLLLLLQATKHFDLWCFTRRSKLRAQRSVRILHVNTPTCDHYIYTDWPTNDHFRPVLKPREGPILHWRRSAHLILPPLLLL